MTEDQIEFLSVAANWAIVAVGVASVVVAIAAVVIAYRQNESMQKHNKLSVKPILHSHIYTKDDEILVIDIYNVGLGPAIITDFKYGYKDQKAHTWSAEPFIELLSELWEEDIRPYLAAPPNWVEFDFPYTIGSGETISLIALKSQDSNLLDLVKLRDVVWRSCEILINYESIYGQKFLLHEP